MLRLDGYEIEPACLTQTELAVDAADATVAVHEFAVGRDHANMGLAVQVVPRAPHHELGVVAECRIRRIPLAGRFVVRHQDPHRRPPDLASQLPASVRVDEGSRVDQLHRRGELEDVLALEKEGTQLRKEERVALVDVDLRLVRFDLREVGVRREVGGQVRRDAVLDVDASLRVGSLPHPVPRRAVERSVLNGGEGREDLEVAARRQVRHPFEHAHLRHEALHVTRHRRPDDVLLVLPLHLARHLEAPAVLRAGRLLRVADALERDRHLCRVAVIDDLGAAVEERLPRPVGDRDRPATEIGRVDDPVALHVVGVEVEVVGPLLIHERVEVDGHQVVLPSRVAVDAVRTQDAGILVVQVEPEIDAVAVVGDVDLGPLGRGHAIEGRLLHELRQERRLEPRLVIQPAIDLGRGVDTRYADARAVRQRAVVRVVRGRFGIVDERSVRSERRHPVRHLHRLRGHAAGGKEHERECNHSTTAEIRHGDPWDSIPTVAARP